MFCSVLIFRFTPPWSPFFRQVAQPTQLPSGKNVIIGRSWNPTVRKARMPLLPTTSSYPQSVSDGFLISMASFPNHLHTCFFQPISLARHICGRAVPSQTTLFFSSMLRHNSQYPFTIPNVLPPSNVTCIPSLILASCQIPIRLYVACTSIIPGFENNLGC